jgi:predicted MFS family arabinose efflux permease
MVACDLVRMVLIAAVTLPGMPVAGMLALLFLAMLAAPPTQAARSALLPLVLRRDQLVVGLAVNTATVQAAQVIGYPAGAALAAVLDPRFALLVDAGTFALSAVLLSVGLRPRPAVPSGEPRKSLLRETAEGFQLVFGAPVLRAIATLVFSLVLFAIVPEGLAAAWAQETKGPAHGLAQGMIMAAGPVGFILGGLTINRFIAADRRQRLIRPFAVLAPLALVPSLFAPPAPAVAAMALVSGFAVSGIMPSLNGIFVLILPPGFRARAFGVMQGGVQLAQGAAVLVTGALAERFELPLVVGAWSVAGVLLMGLIIARWPAPDRFEAAMDATAMAAADRRPAETPAPQPPAATRPPAATMVSSGDGPDAGPRRWTRRQRRSASA